MMTYMIINKWHNLTTVILASDTAISQGMTYTTFSGKYMFD